MKTKNISFETYIALLEKKAVSLNDDSIESNEVIMSIEGCDTTKMGDELVVEIDEDKMFASIDAKAKCCEWLLDAVKDKYGVKTPSCALIARTLLRASKTGLLFLSPVYSDSYRLLTKMSTSISDPLLLGLFFLAGNIGYSEEHDFSDMLSAAYLYQNPDYLKVWLTNRGFGKYADLDSNTVAVDFYTRLNNAMKDVKIDLGLIIDYEVTLHYMAFFNATEYRRKFFGKLNKYLYTKYFIQRKEIERIADKIYNKL